jgi:hypothetical protein
MDSTTHTILSTALLFVAYKLGRHFGYRDGLVDVWVRLLSIFKADKITVTNTDDVIITYPNGKQGKLKVEDHI